MRSIKMAAVLMSAVVLAAAPVQAQWTGYIYGTGEVDTNNTNLQFAGIGFGPSGGDVAPIFSVQAYRLSYGTGTGKTSVFVFKPSAGLRFRLSPEASANLSVGYAFANKNVPGTALTRAGDQGDGVVLAGGLDLHPAASRVMYQGSASYNFGSSSFFGRLRAPIKLNTMSSGTVSLAPEVTYLNGGGYNAIQPGALVLWQGSSGLGLGAGVAFNMPNQGSNSTVFKVEASHSLF